jgi:uncharacterized protein YkwD
MNSAGQHSNILNSAMNRIGVGITYRNGRYWVCEIFKQV